MCNLNILRAHYLIYVAQPINVSVFMFNKNMKINKKQVKVPIRFLSHAICSQDTEKLMGQTDVNCVLQQETSPPQHPGKN